MILILYTCLILGQRQDLNNVCALIIGMEEILIYMELTSEFEGNIHHIKRWLIKDNLFDSLGDFHSLISDLQPINKSYIVLLPKKTVANKPVRPRTDVSKFT
jgi:hypothetical protein